MAFVVLSYGHLAQAGDSIRRERLDQPLGVHGKMANVGMNRVKAIAAIRPKTVGTEEVAALVFAQEQFHAVGEIMKRHSAAMTGGEASPAPLQNLGGNGRERRQVEFPGPVRAPAAHR